MADTSSGSGLAKWLLIGAAVVALVYFGYPLVMGGGDSPQSQPLTKEDWGLGPEGDRPEEETCELTGSRSFIAITSRGASVSSARMLDPKYAESVDKPDTRIQLVSTSKDQRMPLRTSLRFRGEGAQQVDLDVLDFDLDEARSTPTSCVFVFEDANTKLEKTFSLTDRPYELDVQLTVTNKSKDVRKHRFAVEQTSWRSLKETESSFWDLGRRPEWMTEVIGHTTKTTERHLPDAFEPGDFDPEEGFTSEHFKRLEGDGIWAAVSTNYFLSAVAHLSSETAAPASELLVEDGPYYNIKPGDPMYGHMYRARLAYPEKELGEGQTTTYGVLAFFGPKERELVTAAGGPDRAGTMKLQESIDLGMFGFIGKYCVWYVGWLFSLVKSWGWAICLLTITVKILVFPLQLPQLKTTVATRRLKPEIDEITAKYKDDMMQKNLAMQELYRKEGIRPMLGCFPLLLQMPVWIALYQALSSAVELYHTPFLLPLIPDLTNSDPYHVIPIVLGASSFLQQKLMPAQGMDPAQQKMMLYMMPAIFTIMMFFLPAGLGVYMLTNTWLGIIQQLLVERWIGSKIKSGDIQVREIKKKDGGRDSERVPPELGKGKARARG